MNSRWIQLLQWLTHERDQAERAEREAEDLRRRNCPTRAEEAEEAAREHRAAMDRMVKVAEGWLNGR